MAIGRITVVEETVQLAVVEDNVQISISETPIVISEQVVGIQGVGSDAHFTYDQETPASEWTIEHDLGKNPAVTVVDTGGNEWQTSVEHLSPNSLVIRFAAPFAGTAFLN